ncbi:TraR/DksA family transcriptional regulator [Lonsdalea quercina]|uniref:TraR/DksA family transcriptional regulator n=1 Tax=Lonsdalea quercina TaxID=71657 RepID=UPI0039765F24
MDQMDIAQEQELMLREAHIRRARSNRNPQQISASECEECGEPIPATRQLAIPGVTRCKPCQELSELKNRHWRKC